MDRRAAAKAALAFGAGSLSVARAQAAPPGSGVPKAVYHLADLDKVSFVLGNTAHPYKGMGGPGKVRIGLVVHGPALEALHVKHAEAGRSRRFAPFVGDGLEPYACIHTMRAGHVALEDLVAGFSVAERGGVVRLAELQAAGYAYLRP